MVQETARNGNSGQYQPEVRARRESFLNLGRIAARGPKRRVFSPEGLAIPADYPHTEPLVLRTSIRESRLPEHLFEQLHRQPDDVGFAAFGHMDPAEAVLVAEGAGLALPTAGGEVLV